MPGWSAIWGPRVSEPKAGEVFRYPFLWKRQDLQGETEGRKSRPVCIAVTIANANGETVVFILPIATQPPIASRHAVEVPDIEARRVGLDLHVRKWVMLDEINTDIIERSWVWEDRTPMGAFSPAYAAQIRASLLALAKAGKASITDRPK